MSDLTRHRPALSRRALVGASAAGAALAGSSLLPGWVQAAVRQAEEGQFGGTFVGAMPTPPPTLDIHTSTTSAAREVTWFSLETLITYAEDYTLIPLLAESWDVAEDGLSVTFPLRQGVLFHNGDEMMAEDVVASMTRFMEVAPRTSQFAMMSGFEAVDDYTVRFDLSYPSLGFLDALALPFCYAAIFPREIIEGREAGSIEVADVIGTGPYRLVEWVPDQAARFERFEDYQVVGDERSGLGGAKVPYFDTIELIPVPETGARLAGLETSEYDFASSLATTDFDALEGNPDTVAAVNQTYQWAVILFNFRNELSGNLKLRQAIQAVADMEAIALAITNGRPDFFTLQPSLWMEISPWRNDAAAELYNQKNVEKARQLLEESGYAGEEIVLVTNRNYDYMFKGIVALEEQLKSQLGLTTRVDILDWPAQNERWEEPDTWHISTTGYLSQAIFAPDAYSSFYSEGASAGAGYDNPDMQAAFAAALEAATPEERLAAYTEAQRIFHEDVAGLKIADLASIDGLRSNVENFAPWYNATRFWSMWRTES